MWWKNIRKDSKLAVFLFLILILIISCNVSGNTGTSPPISPIPPDSPDIDTTFRFKDPLIGYTWLVIINYVDNLFFFTLFFYLAIYVFKREIGNISSQKRIFFVQLLGTTLAITLTGAVIDLYFLTKQDTNGIYYLHFNLFYWAAATALIFISIFIYSIIISRLKFGPSLLIAGIMATINPLWWIMTGQLGEIVTFVTLGIAIIFVWVPLSKLLDWHSRFMLIRPEAAQKQ